MCNCTCKRRKRVKCVGKGEFSRALEIIRKFEGCVIVNFAFPWWFSYRNMTTMTGVPVIESSIFPSHCLSLRHRPLPSHYFGEGESPEGSL